MPDISQIKLPSGTTYDIKDVVARQAAMGGITLKGVTTTALTDDATTNPIIISGNSYTAQANDAVFYGHAEFVFDGTKWHEFGDRTGLGDLALKDSASGSYTPQGTVSQPTFTGTQGSVSVSGSLPSSVSVGGSSGTEYTPAGSVSAPTVTVTPGTVSKYVAGSASGGGSVTPGSAAQCTLPALTATVQNEVLTLSWSAGSFTPNVPTGVTLPSFSQQTIVTGIQSASASQPTFTGTQTKIGLSNSNKTLTGNFTPQGTVSQPTFTGTPATIEVS